MTRILPKSLAGRLILSLLLVLLLSQIAAYMLYQRDTKRVLLEFEGARAADRVAMMSRLLKDVEPQRRSGVLKAAGTRDMQFF